MTVNNEPPLFPEEPDYAELCREIIGLHQTLIRMEEATARKLGLKLLDAYGVATRELHRIAAQAAKPAPRKKP